MFIRKVSSGPAITASEHRGLMTHLQAPIYFIDFEAMLTRDTFPRNPEDKDLMVSVADIDVSSSLMVFISHCWARGVYEQDCTCVDVYMYMHVCMAMDVCRWVHRCRAVTVRLCPMTSFCASHVPDI